VVAHKVGRAEAIMGVEDPVEDNSISIEN